MWCQLGGPGACTRGTRLLKITWILQDITVIRTTTAPCLQPRFQIIAKLFLHIIFVLGAVRSMPLCFYMSF